MSHPEFLGTKPSAASDFVAPPSRRPSAALARTLLLLAFRLNGPPLGRLEGGATKATVPLTSFPKIRDDSCLHPIDVARLWLLHGAIEVERLGQPSERFGGIRLALKHDVRHAQFRVAAYGCGDLLHRPRQGFVEEARLLWLEIGEPEADERRDTNRRRVAPD